MRITNTQSAKQTRAFEAQRRKYQRPQPVRGLVFRDGQVQWEKPTDAAFNVTHFKLYSDRETNLVRECPVDQTAIGDIKAERVFVSSYNQNSALESIKTMLVGPVGLSDANMLDHSLSSQSLLSGNFFNLSENGGFELGDQGSWRNTGNVNSPIDPPTVAGSWSVVLDANARTGYYCGKHVANAGAVEYFFNGAQIFTNGAIQQFYVEVWAKSSSGATNGTIQLIVDYYDKDGVTVSQIPATVAAGVTTYQKISLMATPPANIVSIRASVAITGHTTGTWYIDDLTIFPPLVLSFNGITTSLDSRQVVTGLGTITAGVDIVKDSTGEEAMLNATEIGFFNSSGNSAAGMFIGGSDQGGIHLRDGSDAGGYDSHGSWFNAAGDNGQARLLKVLLDDLTTTIAFQPVLATSANAGAQTLPANPVGFITVVINGTNRKIPYYAT